MHLENNKHEGGPKPGSARGIHTRILIAIVAVLSGIAILPTSLCGQAATACSDCRSILSNVITTMGTSSAFAANSTAIGHIRYADGRSGDITIRTLGVNLLQTTTSMGGVTQTVTTNDTGAFLDKDGKRSQMPLWFAESRIAEALPMISIQSWIQRPDLTISEVIGKDASPSSARQFHVQMVSDGTLQGDADQQIYDFTISIDPATLQLLSIRTKWFADDTLTNFMSVDVTYDDYRIVNGMTIPFHISYYSDGSLLSDVVLDSLDVISNNTPANFN